MSWRQAFSQSCQSSEIARDGGARGLHASTFGQREMLIPALATSTDLRRLIPALGCLAESSAEGAEEADSGYAAAVLACSLVAGVGVQRWAVRLQV